MMDEEARAAKPDLYAHPTDDELARLSVDDLNERVEWLTAEIGRTQEVLVSKEGAIASAESFFKK